ncbi:FAD-dependent oxidoreductase [Modestobacter sp. I12A-02628]|uniref:FAD-dependent oxidoreductase n=1 Tax=Goekera deserti TaxID=2497753 RepID=A0A7K3WKN7_9ACTN|nr:FAD-dependent oxidoreductase [Goekera deserti]MPQ99320.1 FAD-dependent oxidoreductase [Goekera deserti]NDI50319.1 FAD-dependent oxidoreductase [Goekera deserti]NEL56429.1 FAD-dependent oxidoreductase [Goekera deserti]
MPRTSTTVIGAGISGIACARALSEAGVAVQVLDRGNRPGGRMSGRTLHGRVVDLGASYFTATDDSPFAAVVAAWVQRGLARPWTDTFAVAGPGGIGEVKRGPMRYAASGGLRELVVDLARGLDVVQRRTVSDVAPGPRVDGEDCAAAVLAMPDPQARRLLERGSLADQALDARGWQATIAVVLGFADRQWPADLHGAFVHDSPVVDWVADDGDRRGDGAPVLVAHTTPAFAEQHLAEPDGAVAEVVAAVRQCLGIDAEPEWTHAHRWTFAKPSSPREQPFHLAEGIGICGDGWSVPSKVQGAWTSGHALGVELARTAG